MGRTPPPRGPAGAPGPHAGLSFPRQSVGMPCPGGTTGLVFPRLNIELPQPCWRPKPPGVWGAGPLACEPARVSGEAAGLGWRPVRKVQVGAGRPPREGLFAWRAQPPPLRPARLTAHSSRGHISGPSGGHWAPSLLFAVTPGSVPPPTLAPPSLLKASFRGTGRGRVVGPAPSLPLRPAAQGLGVLARAHWCLQVVVGTGRAPAGRLRIHVCLCAHVWVCACDPCVQVSAWGPGAG